MQPGHAYHNAAAERLFRVSAAEVKGQSVQQFIPERFRSRHQAGLRAWLAARLPAGQTALAERARAMLALTNTAIHSVRRIGTELRPGVLDDLGLVAALKWQAREFQTRTDVACEFIASQKDLALTPAVSTVLFRICQEALPNVARHARATRISVRLREESEGMVLTVADNSRGITDQEITNRTSFGIHGMQERALDLGGQVSIGGRPGEGTTITVRIPLVTPSLQKGSEDPRKPDPMLRSRLGSEPQ